MAAATRTDEFDDDSTRHGTCCGSGCLGRADGTKRGCLGPCTSESTETTNSTIWSAFIKPMPLAASVREMRTPRFWRDVICEVMVTALLFFFIFGMAFNFTGGEPSLAGALVVGVGAGCYVFVLIEAFGHVQLAVMNPAVALHFVLTGRLGFLKGILYVIAECLGAILGTQVIYQCAPSSVRPNFAPLAIHPDMRPVEGVLVEFVITASLVFAISGSQDDRNRKVYMPGLPIGLSVTGGILATHNFTGGALNPVASLGPAFVTGNWTNHWIYWVGPMLGGLTATLSYHFFTYDRGVFEKSYPLPASRPRGGASGYEPCALQADVKDNSCTSPSITKSARTDLNHINVSSEI